MTELRRVSLGILIAFMLVALAAAYWGVARSDVLLQRADNPRQVVAERVLDRGNIFDTNGILLAETTVNYNGEGLRRLYPHPEVAPAVGYYSQRYGTSGIESSYDDMLRGDVGPSPFAVALRDLRHDSIEGGDVRLTLDLPVQKAALEALGEYRGAVLVVTVPDGKVRAMVSAPSFDPNVLDVDWSVLVQSAAGPLLNRITQGVYQPGAALETALVAAALSERIATDQTFPGAVDPVEINGLILECGVTPPRRAITLAEAYAYACPEAFTVLGESMPAATVDKALWRFGLVTTPAVLGLTTDIADSPLPLALDPDGDALAAGLTGQGNLAVSPLQMMDLIAAIAGNGNAPLLRVVDAVRIPGQTTWETVPVTGLSRALLTSETAARMRDLMAVATEYGVASAARAVSSVPVIGHAATAYSGPASTLQWFVGMTLFEDGTAIAVVVVVEDAPSPEVAAIVGGRAISAAAERYTPATR